MNRFFRDTLAWFTIALILSLMLLAIMAVVDFPAMIARLLIAVIGFVFLGSLVMDHKKWCALGFLLGYTPLSVFVFTPYGEGMALTLLALLS